TDMSRSVHAMLMRDQSGRIRRAALIKAGITHADLYRAHTLEWRRKKDINEVLPGIPIAQVREICRRVAEHNQEVRRLTKLWELLIRTLQGDFDRSPWLQYRPDEPIPISTTAAE